MNVKCRSLLSVNGFAVLFWPYFAPFCREVQRAQVSAHPNVWFLQDEGRRSLNSRD